MDEHQKLARAKQKVESITAFYMHLAAFVLVNILLLVVNAVSGDGWWVQWPIVGWGFGVLAHAWVVFGRIPTFIANWQVRKIRALKDQM